MVEQSETDDDDELIDNMYIAENFGTGKNDGKHAENMLKRFENNQKEMDEQEKDLPEEQKF